MAAPSQLLSFDLAADEIHLFLQEADEQIQTLEENLVRLELEPDNEPLFQATFRAAHTIKGSAGIIGHQRMADLTHSMESVLDRLRTGKLTVTPLVVDALLDALDILRALRDEILTLAPAPVDVAALVDRLRDLAPTPAPANKFSSRKRSTAKTSSRKRGSSKSTNAKTGASKTTARKKAASKSKARKKVSPKSPARETRTPRAKQKKPAQKSRSRDHPAAPGYLIQCDITPDSIAPAARAYQLVLALQALGQVDDLDPPLEVIESAAPVQRLTARLLTTKSKTEVRQALEEIPEIDRLTLDGEAFDLGRLASGAAARGQSQEAQRAPTSADDLDAHLGDLLVSTGHITQAQLETALRQQAAEPGKRRLLGQTLVQMGVISQERVDQVVAQHMQRLRSEPAAQKTTREREKIQGVEKTVRISVERLDALMNLAGELVTDRNRLFQMHRQLAAAYPGAENIDELGNTALRLSRITDQLQEEVMQIRMLPVASVFHKFPRVVRDLARKSGKQVKLVIRGEETELDRSLLEIIGDPLTHIIRNAVDHGLELPAERTRDGKPELGTVLLAARHEAGRIIISVEDDGRGISAAAVRQAAVHKGVLSEKEAEALPDDEVIDLIFHSGLSTASKVTDVSGRGVGMDIVRANIERLNGSIAIETWPGEGTRFEFSLPLTLAIFPALLVRIDAIVCALPLSDVVEAIQLAPTDVKTVSGRPVFKLRDHVLPLVDLSTIFNWSPINGAGNAHIVVARWGKQEMGLRVGSLVGEEDIVIKPLGAVVSGGGGISGAAIMGDGRVALVLDIPGIFRLASLATAV